mmetsp:Transcript_20224/g.47517  ORF Transcript_20224/g.47517 Transcript_20224/m.47517 type:complete len:415 (-) Transcript_20224:489-1733(-)
MIHSLFFDSLVDVLENFIRVLVVEILVVEILLVVVVVEELVVVLVDAEDEVHDAGPHHRGRNVPVPPELVGEHDPSGTQDVLDAVREDAEEDDRRQALGLDRDAIGTVPPGRPVRVVLGREIAATGGVHVVDALRVLGIRAERKTAPLVGVGFRQCRQHRVVRSRVLVIAQHTPLIVRQVLRRADPALGQRFRKPAPRVLRGVGRVHVLGLLVEVVQIGRLEGRLVLVLAPSHGRPHELRVQVGPGGDPRCEDLQEPGDEGRVVSAPLVGVFELAMLEDVRDVLLGAFGQGENRFGFLLAQGASDDRHRHEVVVRSDVFRLHEGRFQGPRVPAVASVVLALGQCFVHAGCDQLQHRSLHDGELEVDVRVGFIVLVFLRDGVVIRRKEVLFLFGQLFQIRLVPENLAAHLPDVDR